MYIVSNCFLHDENYSNFEFKKMLLAVPIRHFFSKNGSKDLKYIKLIIQILDLAILVTFLLIPSIFPNNILYLLFFHYFC